MPDTLLGRQWHTGGYTLLVQYVSCPVEDPRDHEMDYENPSVFWEGWPGRHRVQGNKKFGNGIHLPQGGLYLALLQIFEFLVLLRKWRCNLWSKLCCEDERGAALSEWMWFTASLDTVCCCH